MDRRQQALVPPHESLMIRYFTSLYSEQAKKVHESRKGSAPPLPITPLPRGPKGLDPPVLAVGPDGRSGLYAPFTGGKGCATLHCAWIGSCGTAYRFGGNGCAGTGPARLLKQSLVYFIYLTYARDSITLENDKRYILL